MGASVTAAKQHIRTLIIHRLSSIAHDAILTQSRAIFDALVSFQPYRDARSISLFLSMPAAEVQTDAIVRHALTCGKHVFVPYLHRASAPDLPPQKSSPPHPPNRVMDMVQLRSVDDYDSLRRDRWGIPSVDPASVPGRQRILAPDAAELDLVLLPGVAFDTDEAGFVRRLGHGRGFYDYFISRYLHARASSAAASSQPVLPLYGLALSEQLLLPASGEQVPMDVHDHKLHGLILGSGSIIESPKSQI
ncbi:hypothetical protein CDD81_1202 [Ophiocordyceps australis]|uniref:5-formyltetrahydrofolate cyclo-ligase n=1 Tax=Ophiocordyceps australis TaxID=1399860 RepID=A0A2C5YE06_9HYPO|nr:hypothetical protein CDD81_1202 [Ophiocordyceps australis]